MTPTKLRPAYVDGTLDAMAHLLTNEEVLLSLLCGASNLARAFGNPEHWTESPEGWVYRCPAGQAPYLPHQTFLAGLIIVVPVVTAIQDNGH